MKNSRVIGNAAENAAAEWIEKNKGYIVLERNYSCAAGEIDIIAKDKDTTVFIEVKYRKNTKKGYPSEAVTETKQKRIIRTAMAYVSQNNTENIRFDVAEIVEKDGRKYIRYIENAFEWRSYPWY